MAGRSSFGHRLVQSRPTFPLKEFLVSRLVRADQFFVGATNGLLPLRADWEKTDSVRFPSGRPASSLGQTPPRNEVPWHEEGEPATI